MRVHTVLSPLPGTFYRRPSPDQRMGVHCFHSNTPGCMEIAGALHPARLANGISIAPASDLPAKAYREQWVCLRWGSNRGGRASSIAGFRPSPR
jgi:hypothetical protein